MSLWQEYAIEPSLFGDYSQARYLLDDFGMDSGRLIGGFPRKWQKAVRNHLSKCSDLQRKTIIERLNKLNRVIVPRTHPFDGNIAWKVQAFECDRIKPFHAIITDGPDPHSKAIDGTALLDAFPLWKAAGQTKVPRTADELASAIEVILRQCHEIIIVDREFIPSGGTNNKWLKPFASLAKILVQQNSVQRIELNALEPIQEVQDSGPKSWPGQASEHDADHCETNEGGGGSRVAFEVAGEAPIAANPGECSLDQRLYNVAKNRSF